METLYEKVIIKSEADLPKERDYYVVHRKGSDCDYPTAIQFFLPKNATSINVWNDYDWYLRPVPQPERKTAEEILREHCNFEFDRFNGEELVHSSLGAVTIAMQEYAAQGIASENTIPYIKSEHDHQLPRIAKIIGKDKFVFEQSINALLYIIETQGIDWPSEEESNEILDKKAFRVPYDGSDNFYDESFIKGWKACYEWFLKRLKK